MTPELQQRIDQQAREYAIHHSSAPDKETPDWIIRDWTAGATLYAERVEELEAENALLKERVEKMEGALEKILQSKRLPGETNDTYLANRMWHIATNALQWKGEK